VHRNLQDTPSPGKLTEADLDAAIARKFLPIHPTIAFALAPLRPPVPVVYRAALGRQRAFLSFSDAAAYDRGYRNHPAPFHAERGTPEAMGWADAHDDADGAAGMDDMAEWANTHGAECGRHL
jgi:hypothetical protein